MVVKQVIQAYMANGFLVERRRRVSADRRRFLHKEAAVFEAIQALGRSPRELKHLIFTHGHPDHIGSAAAIVRATGCTPLDIPMAETGGSFRPLTPARGLLRGVLCKLFFHPNERLDCNLWPRIPL